MRGFSRLIISALGRRIPEKQAFTYLDVSKSLVPSVVEFKGIGDLFTPLLADHDFIRRQLWSMTREPLRSTGEKYGGRFIAMHIRRGDLTRQGFTVQKLKNVKQFTPLSWFVDMAQLVRRFDCLRSVPIVVFTDGASEEVEGLRSIDGICLRQPQRAITDLWTMAHAGLLFASGFSTFSMWASFLGGMPTIYAPGKIQQYVQLGRPHAIEMELAEGQNVPVDAFVRLSGSS